MTNLAPAKSATAIDALTVSSRECIDIPGVAWDSRGRMADASARRRLASAASPVPAAILARTTSGRQLVAVLASPWRRTRVTPCVASSIASAW